MLNVLKGVETINEETSTPKVGELDPDVADRLDIEKVSKELFEILVMLTEGRGEDDDPERCDPGRHPRAAPVVTPAQPAHGGERAADASRGNAPEGIDGYRELDLLHR